LTTCNILLYERSNKQQRSERTYWKQMEVRHSLSIQYLHERMLCTLSFCHQIDSIKKKEATKMRAMRNSETCEFCHHHTTGAQVMRLLCHHQGMAKFRASGFACPCFYPVFIMVPGQHNLMHKILPSCMMAGFYTCFLHGPRFYTNRSGRTGSDSGHQRAHPTCFLCFFLDEDE